MDLPPLHLLQTLSAFGQHGTVAKAADSLKATQPTVTRQLQQLESWAKTPLFETRGRKKLLTEYGRQLAEAFTKRFHDFEIDVEEASQLWSDPSRRVLRVGARREILLDRFAALEFLGKLDLVPMGSQRIEHELMKQSLDIAVVQVEVDTPAYAAKKLFASRAELLMPKRWSREMPGARDLNTLCERHPFATFSSERPYLESFAGEFSLAALPEPSLIVNDWPIVEERVHKQMAWTIAPSSLAREGRGYWRIELPESIGWEEFFLYTRRSLSRLPWFRELVGKVGLRRP